jgi:tRNA threonylcarbamoyladenosine biosynthesis protein TsaE
LKLSNQADTVFLAKEFSSNLKKGDRIVLNGQLGSGKTFFIKACLRNFKINNVNSPTFAIVNEYNNGHRFYHFDFYRINSITELLDIGFYDYLNDEESIIFIEWGNLFPDILPEKKTEINIKIISDSEREFEIKKYE